MQDRDIFQPRMFGRRDEIGVFATIDAEAALSMLLRFQKPRAN